MQSENKLRFKSLCEERKDIPYFLRYGWLSNLLDDHLWDVALAETDGVVWGVMPYHIKQKLGFTIITMPPLTPYIGPWVLYPEGQKQVTKLGHGHKVMDSLIGQLPQHQRFIQYFHPAITNVMSFQWKEYSIGSRFTYVLPDLSNLQALEDGLESILRNKIRKAEKTLTVVDGAGPQVLHQLKRADYTAKGVKLDHDEAYMLRVDKAVRAVGSYRYMDAVDTAGQPVASLLLVWDSEQSYYLVSAVDPTHRSTGAMSMLVWEAVKFAATVTRSFNFEGGMIEPIERFFRGFGAEQRVYHEVRKTPSRVLRAVGR